MNLVEQRLKETIDKYSNQTLGDLLKIAGVSSQNRKFSGEAGY
jgi:hypothetical protein